MLKHTVLLLACLLAALGVAAQHAPAGRLAPALRGPRASREVRVLVRDEVAFRQWARRALPGVALASAGTNVLTLTQLRAEQLMQLAASPLVEFVDVPVRRAHDERLLGGADLTVNNLRATQRRYPTLRGQGLAVSIKENPLDLSDLDLRGRLLNTPPGTVTVSTHATIMATLAAGGGNSGPAGEGAAPQAGIASASYANLLPDANADLQRLSVSVQNHSYGTGIENYYGLEARAYDQQVRELPGLLHVFSSGNAGTGASTSGLYQGLAGWANLTGQFKQSKNSLSVGATSALGEVALASSRGPAYDGRLKPELVAFGDAGSSDAAALVSGAALLVQQAYRDGPGQGVLPPAALVKAALLNSALDAGRPEVDYAAGYGQLNALAAVRTVLAGRMRQGSLGQGQEQLLPLVVPPGTARLKVTLAWTDPEAAANAPAALVHDLDLAVLAPDGRTWLPWVLSAYPHPDSLSLPARRGPDHRNNAEQVTLAAPAPGTYQLRVRGYAVATGPQAYALAYEATPAGFEWLVPAAIRNVLPGQTTRLRWAWPGPAAAGRLDYRPLGGSWRPIAPTADLSQLGYAWTAPDTTTLAQLRCVVGGQAYLSDTFALARPLPLRVGYVCTDEALLSWPAVPGATAYQVFTLGSTAPVPLQATSDTLLQLGPAQLPSRYFAVAPMLGGRLAERSTTQSLPDAGVGCYVQSLLPLPPVADTARLVLALGTLYQLRSVQLQRLGSGGSFSTIQALSPPQQGTTVFTDLGAGSGLNQYRVVGETITGRRFVSDTATVQLVRAGELLVYPVPAIVGQELQVAGQPGQPLHLVFFDVLGRPVRTLDVSGALNPVPTNGLRAGVYLLQATPAGGRPLARRLLLLEQ